jgi:hypothetical protein
MMPSLTAAYNAVPQNELARGMSMVNVSFRLFGAISTAVLTTTLVVSLTWHGAPDGSSITEGTAPIAYMVDAYHDAFLLMAGMTVLSLALSFFLRDAALEAARKTSSGGGGLVSREPVASVEA